MSSSARLGIAGGQGDFKRIIVEGYDHAGEVEVQLHMALKIPTGEQLLPPHVRSFSE